MSKLTESQIEIMTAYYSNRYGIPEAWGDLYNILERHRQYIIEEIKKNLLTKVLKITKIKAALRSKNDDEIIIKFIVHK